MSSSEETDKEEDRRISEAVFCIESRADLFAGKNDSKEAQHDTSVTGSAVTETSFSKSVTDSKKVHCKDLLDISYNPKKSAKTLEPHLKSKRPDRRQDDDEGINNSYILKTTPEFRAFVAKHLEKHLDKELETCLTSAVWKSKDHIVEKGKEKPNKKRGIKLLSNSKCMLGDTTPMSTPSLKKNSSVKKPRLSTSSESSEDEKIQACVFTVKHIQEENERLASLISEESTGTEKQENPDGSSQGSSTKNKVAIDLDEGGLEKSKKKKKTKRKKLKDVS